MVRKGDKAFRDESYRDTRSRLKRDRFKPEAKSVTNDAIPNKGEPLEDGGTFGGLVGDKMADNFLTTRHFPEDQNDKKRKLPASVMVDDANLQTINGSKLESLSVDEDKINGDGADKKISWGKIDHPALAGDGHAHGEYIKAIPDWVASKTWVKNNTAGPSNNKENRHGHTAN